MRVLFLGWEFPPNITGGLGVHTYNIIKALVKAGIEVILILPEGKYEKLNGVKIEKVPLDIDISVYSANKFNVNYIYSDLIKAVNNYMNNAIKIAQKYDFDIIQANDWLTILAGIEIKKIKNKPLIFTIHSTEYDRTIGNPWKWISDIENFGSKEADAIVTVSNRLKNEIIELYKVDPHKIKVIYNAIDKQKFNRNKINAGSKLVLYVGRLSIQKGVDHLIMAFKIVSDIDKDAILGIAGEGPELNNLINLTIDLNINNKVVFFGRVSDEELEQLYQIARVFVMPSVSEPFGITALESLASKTPTIISIQSGVSEVINNVFKINFWDSYQMADIILGILQYPAVGEEISRNAYNELMNITWENSAQKFIDLYNSLTH